MRYRLGWGWWNVFTAVALVLAVGMVLAAPAQAGGGDDTGGSGGITCTSGCASAAVGTSSTAMGTWLLLALWYLGWVTLWSFIRS